MRSVLTGASALLVAVGLVVAIWLLARPLALLVAAIVLAEALSPIADRLHRWIPRPLAIALVSVALFLLVGIVVWFILPVLIDQVQQVVMSGPDLLAAARRWIDHLGPVSSDQIQGAVTAGLERAGNAFIALPLAIASSAFEILAIIFMSVYWLVEKPALRRFALSFFPMAERERAGSVLSEMDRSMGG